MFQFTPLQGAQSSSAISQSLLELEGGVRILIDLGWNGLFDVKDLETIKQHIPSISFILLTHATLSHLGAYAHCCKHFPGFEQLPVYATSPVISLGRTLLQDVYASTPAAATVLSQKDFDKMSISFHATGSDEAPQILLDAPSPIEIASYFARIHPLKYSQPHQPIPSSQSPPLNDLTITAFNAGHTLGGTIWHIQHSLESIVYAVHWNQARENVFAGAAWIGASDGAKVIEQLHKPTALVCSSKGAKTASLLGGRAKRDAAFLDLIEETVVAGGIVLIPTDSAARVLELAFVLERVWRREWANPTSTSLLRGAKVVVASHTIESTIRYARSMPEWMDESVVREFEAEMALVEKPVRRGDSKGDINPSAPHLRDKPNGPFDFRYVKLVQTRKRMEKFLTIPGPKIILASDASLEWGFAKEFLGEIAANDNNLVLLTEDRSRSYQSEKPNSSVCGSLWECLASDSSAVRAGKVLCKGKKITLNTSRRVALDGRQLAVYQQYLAIQKQAHEMTEATKTSSSEVAGDVIDDASSSSSDDESDSEHQGRALNASTTASRLNKNKIEPSRESLGVNALLRLKDVYDFDVRGRKGRDQTFPFLNRRHRVDDFGAWIKPEDYLRAEERDEIDGQDLRGPAGGGDDKIGMKRKWQDALVVNGSRTKDKRNIAPGGAFPEGEAQTVEKQAIYGEASSESEEEVEPADSKLIPSRLEWHQDVIEARMNVAFIDFEGLHDQRSLSMLIPLIQPKKLVLIAGDVAETASLAEDCQQKLRIDSQSRSNKSDQENCVHTPKIGQTIDASVDSNTWTVKLSEALAKQLHWQDVRGFGISTVSGHLIPSLTEEGEQTLNKLGDTDGDAQERKKLKMTGDETQTSKIISVKTMGNSALPTLDVLPLDIVAATRVTSQPFHVGDLRLADLRKLLLASGHTAEFRGEGILLIDGVVAVRKSGTGKVELESALLATGNRAQEHIGSFHTVRQRIYEGLALITG